MRDDCFDTINPHGVLGVRAERRPLLRDWRSYLAAQALRALQSAWTLVWLWHRRARTRRQLFLLDNRQLRDIGLTRADAEREACKPFWLP